MFGNVPLYRGRPQELFDGSTAATIVFGHDPDELDRVIDAHFEQRPASVVDLIPLRGPPFGTVFGRVESLIKEFNQEMRLVRPAGVFQQVTGNGAPSNPVGVLEYCIFCRSWQSRHRTGRTLWPAESRVFPTLACKVPAG